MFEIIDLAFRDILSIEHLIIDQPVTCITGPSGGGKTTLLRMLNRLNAPEKGKVLYNGADIATKDPVLLRREVLMLGQTPVIYDGDLRENLVIGMRFAHKALPDDDTLHQCLIRVMLDKPLDDSCATLSGGEKQRLCLARVLLMDAKVYLLDEPSSALDKETELFIVQHLAQLARKSGKQLILVTHSERIAEFCQAAMIHIEKGRVIS